MERKMGRRWDRMVMDSHGGRRRRVVDRDGRRRRLGRSRGRGPGQPPRPPPRRVRRRRAGAFSGRPGRPRRRERRQNVEEADALLGDAQDVALRVRARGEAREAREVRNRVVIVICLVDDKPRRSRSAPSSRRSPRGTSTGRGTTRGRRRAPCSCGASPARRPRSSPRTN